jgi:hypothetical protein
LRSLYQRETGENAATSIWIGCQGLHPLAIDLRTAGMSCLGH